MPAVPAHPFAITMRHALAAVEGAVACSAAGGAVYGLSGAPGVPRSWLHGSPFHSYLIPSLVLLVAVAGSAAVALAALAAARRRAPELAICAGGVLIAWIAVEMVYIPFSWLQPVCVAAGAAMIGLGRRMDCASRSTRGDGRCRGPVQSSSK